MKRRPTATVLYLITLVVLFELGQSALAQAPRPRFVPGSRKATSSSQARRATMPSQLDARIQYRVASLQDTIEIPFQGTVLELKRTKAKFRGIGNVTWIGRVRGKQSSVVLTVVNGFLFGRVEMDGQPYLIQPSATGYTMERQDPALAGSRANDTLAPPALGAHAQDVFATAEDGTQIDVLVLYTSQLSVRYTTALPAMIQNYVDVANLGYDNSGVNTQLRLVGVEPYTGVGAVEGVSVCTAVQSITSDATIASLRNSYNADLVSLMRLFQSSACGCGWVMQSVSPSFESSAFSVVEVRPAWDANPYYCDDTTLAHELGHNMGCAHDRDHATVTGAYSYSYGYDVAGVFATIMSYDTPGITYFSTPSVTYAGYPIGIAEGQPDSADNARTINNTRTTVANFRVAAEPDLSITKAHTGDFTAGEQGVYSLLIQNMGAQATTSQIMVTDTLPSGLFYINATGAGWNCSVVSQTVQCTTSQSLAAGGSSTITLTVAVGAAAVPSVINTASISCADDITPGNNSSSDVTTVQSAPVFRSEVGNAPADSSWRRVDLTDIFADPVVVAKVFSNKDVEPAVVRIRNITSTSFEIRVQEWDYLDQTHALEDVSYLVIERGHWTLSGGIQVEAGSIDTSRCGVGSPVAVSFASSFPTKPLVFSAVVSFNDTQAVTTRMTGVTQSGFRISMQEQEKDPLAAQVNPQIHGTERLSFIAIEQKSGSLGALSFLTGQILCPHTFKQIPGTTYQLKVEEEQAWDAEIEHLEESIGYLLFTGVSGSHLLADMQTTYGMDVASVRYHRQGSLEAGEVRINNNWTKVMLNGRYADPVIVANPLSHYGGDPSVVRIRNVTNDSFEIRVQELDYCDQAHGFEPLSYLVIEAGRWTLPNGKIIEAGMVDWAQPDATTWRTVTYSVAFPTAPVVFASGMTANGTAVRTRNSQVSSTGFKVLLQEQEREPGYAVLNSHRHTTETIGWVAVEKGAGMLPGAGAFEVSSGTGFDGNFRNLSFTQSYATAPLFLADMQTMADPDPAGLRYWDRTNLRILLRLQEDQSWDSETTHGAETVGYVAIGWAGKGVVFY
jgi:uncharacterized repeat protein (TIGR01451 family)